MAWKLGVVLGILAAASVIFAGATRGISTVGTIWRAVLAAAAGFLLGWLVFGKLAAAMRSEDKPR